MGSVLCSAQHSTAEQVCKHTHYTRFFVIVIVALCSCLFFASFDSVLVLLIHFRRFSACLCVCVCVLLVCAWTLSLAWLIFFYCFTSIPKMKWTHSCVRFSAVCVYFFSFCFTCALHYTSYTILYWSWAFQLSQFHLLLLFCSHTFAVRQFLQLGFLRLNSIESMRACVCLSSLIRCVLSKLKRSFLIRQFDRERIWPSIRTKQFFLHFYRCDVNFLLSHDSRQLHFI